MRISNTTKPQSVPYLFQSRHGIWYARVVVPKSLRSQVGQRDLKQSLRTRCKREAIQRSWQVLDQLACRASGKEPEVVKAPQKPNERQAEPAAVQTHNPNSQVASKPKDDSPRLSEVVKLFTAEKLKVNAWKPHEVAHNEFAYRELLEIVGDIRLSQFTGKVGLKYKQHFLDAGKLSVATINKRIGKVKNLLQWAVPHFGNDNPMVGMTIKQKVRAKEQRKAVSDSQVRALLDATRKQTDIGTNSFKRWLPFLGAYTGARIAELSQLYLDDFTVMDGLPCIHIRADKPDQSLKTPSSERVIPIHQALIDEGFLMFVEKQMAAGHKRLFPELPSGNQRGFGHKPSLWFTKFRAKLGWGEGETFHSLRHTVITKLKRDGFSVDRVAGLVGHGHGSITFDRYGKSYRVVDVAPLVNSLRY